MLEASISKRERVGASAPGVADSLQAKSEQLPNVHGGLGSKGGRF